MRGVREYERFNKRRMSWTIGSDGGTTYGYKPGAFGALRPHAVNKEAVTACTVDSANLFAIQSVDRIFHGIDSFDITVQEWTGNPITMTWNAGNSAYEATVAGLNAFCAARQGRQLRLSPGGAGLVTAGFTNTLYVGFSGTDRYGFEKNDYGDLVPAGWRGAEIVDIFATAAAVAVVATADFSGTGDIVLEVDGFSGNPMTLSRLGTGFYQGAVAGLDTYLNTTIGVGAPVGLKLDDA